ncbi:MAG: preprotein translocase subunit SecA [Ignavibacteria bacterium]|nr:preprotein translocase subunit SecA [Ignavibacteria bacterium]
MLQFLKRIFGSKHERDVRQLEPTVELINQYYAQLSTLSAEELRAKTDEFRERINAQTADLTGEIRSLKQSITDDLAYEQREELYAAVQDAEKRLDQKIEEVLASLLPEAYAVVKDACRRLQGEMWDIAGHKVKWEMVPFDVQLMGGMVLHQGKIAEMATGEGKTLVATLPVYLNALTGRGVHLVTVNDYLALRDSQWMGRVYELLGLKVGVILQHMTPEERKRNYAADITYGTNNEFGFDYLRDNMVVDPEHMVQRGHNYAIVDEVDSVLVDEARTPLIISGPVEVDDHKFNEMKPHVERLVNSQKSLVAKLTSDAEALLNEGKTEEAGVLLLRAQRGFPKNKKLLKIFAEPANKTLTQSTEKEYLRDQAARMHEIDDELFYSIDEKSHIIDLTDKGREYLAQSYPGRDKELFVIPDVGTEFSAIDSDQNLSAEQKEKKKDEVNKLFAERSDRIHTIRQLLKAYSLYEKDDEYVVSEDGKVMIVDEFTGRLLPGRRYSEGLHQAIEAKEGVKVERDTQTLATITLQNYFRMYKKLAGMTGTAETEAPEFFDIYELDVVVIPTNRPMIRTDHDDLVYKTVREKYNAVIGEIEEMRAANRPTLVGTTSVEVSETISRMLKRKGIPHNVLNAKHHQREAEIVAHAGLPGTVTIATNMAGRGTDIKLGPGIADAGGLHIVGTERHESRRIDRQLRGRSGRQGDPGSSRFFISLEDDLMRLFGSERISRVMERMGMKEGESIQHPMISRSVERAQKKVEENNFGIRKRLLEYDNVMNQQREVIYSRRKHALLGDRLRDDIMDMLRDVAAKVAGLYFSDGDVEGLRTEVRSRFLVDLQLTPEKFQSLGEDGVVKEIVSAAELFYKRKEERLGADMMRTLEKISMLQVIDSKWREHLREMDDLKEGIHLRGYGQKDPLVEYKAEAFKMFMELLEMISDEALSMVFKLFPEGAEQLPAQRARRPLGSDGMVMTHESALGAGMRMNRDAIPPRGGGEHAQASSPGHRPQPIRVAEKVGRNEPCPCGSGKKYKNCHGA